MHALRGEPDEEQHIERLQGDRLDGEEVGGHDALRLGPQELRPARSFIATGAMVFNRASLGEACVVALDGKVHIDTDLRDDGRVPMGYIAVGRPSVLYAPDDAPVARDAVDRIGFMSYVFGVDLEGRSRAETMEEAMSRYVRALGAHSDDELVG